MASGLKLSLFFLMTLGGCQVMESPRQQLARRDDQLAGRLATHLRTVPGIASISLAITSDEPNASWLPSAVPGCTTRPAVVITLIDELATAAITDAVRTQLRGLLPSACPATITVMANPAAAHAHDAHLTSVGPFRVDAASKRPLQVTLAALLIALGAMLVFRRRAVAA